MHVNMGSMLQIKYNLDVVPCQLFIIASNVGRYIGITCTSVHVFRLIELCATVSNNCIDVM